MNIKELANQIDNNQEETKALYHFFKNYKKGDHEGEVKTQVLLSEISFIFHSLDLYQGHDPATFTRQYEIISQVSALFIELNKLLIHNP